MTEARLSRECESSCLPTCDEIRYDHTSRVLAADPHVECEDPGVIKASLENINLVGDKLVRTK